MKDVIGVIAVFGALPLIIYIVLYFRHKTAARSADIIKSLIDKDVSITPDIIKSIGFVPRRAHADLRTALLWLAVGFATLLFGGAIPEEDGQRVFTGLASFPILIGLVLLIFWVLVGRKSTE